MKEMNLDGSNKRAICKLTLPGQSIFDVYRGNIYFSEESQGSDWTQSLYRANIATGAKQQLVNKPLEFSMHWQRFKEVTAIGDVVYYYLDENIYVVNNDGSNHKRVNLIYTYGGRFLKLKVK
ncbi:hypothetical protein [Paenibacillus ihumii]|uniref:hypothetical protein n=1 Tax=Paenibacillus ihumii TaxID=687436 RepID=UPI001CA38087|nr:hypothetical protein [Paenibacillus ihumii]